jgi:hypothetical protein
MTRIGMVVGTLLLALAFVLGPAGCAQVLGIGDPKMCTDGTEYCDAVCVDLGVDPENCGACGKSCAGAACVEGQCVDSDCNREFVACSAPASAASECHGLDCVEFAAVTTPVCLRRCRTSDECPMDMYCAPKGENAYRQGFGQFVLAGGHCVFSYCGGVNGTWFANGVANGGCRVGGDGYLNEGAVTKAGTCVVLKSGAAGYCFEAGKVQRGYGCTLNVAGCVERADYHACGEGDVCLGQSTATEGICYQVCDPKTSGQCPAGMTCRDKSSGNMTAGACEY